MSDYQAIYDSVRDAWQLNQIMSDFQSVCHEQMRPSVLYKPTITQDGNAWIALLGTDLGSGAAGSGDSPEEAMRDFDSRWYQKATLPTSGMEAKT